MKNINMIEKDGKFEIEIDYLKPVNPIEPEKKHNFYEASARLQFEIDKNPVDLKNITIATAPDERLNRIGKYYNTIRNFDETDTDYRTRILKAVRGK